VQKYNFKIKQGSIYNKVNINKARLIMESKTFDPRLALDSLMYVNQIRNINAVAAKANLAPSSLTRLYNGQGDSKLSTWQSIADSYQMPLLKVIALGFGERKIEQSN
jgi:DNA-binding phage protein